MIDADELLRKKENDLARVRCEVESLRIVAPLLSDTKETSSSEGSEDASKIAVHVDSEGNANTQPLPPKKKVKRNWLGRAVGE